MKNIALILIICLTAALAVPALAGNAAEQEAPESMYNLPVSLAHVAGLDGADIENAVIAAFLIDCEDGPHPVELSPEQEKAVRRMALSTQVTEKVNDSGLTGGMTSYVFLSPDGEYLGSFEIYEGLLLLGDGMYRVSEPGL